jgi:hypothetical protein
MKKTILLSAMVALIVFQTSCKTSENTSESPSIFTNTSHPYWTNPGLTADLLTATNFVMTLDSNGTFTLTYQAGGNNTQSGTFSPTTLPPQTVITFTVVADSGPNVPPLPGSWLLKYDNLTETTVDIYLDLAMDGFQGPFQFTKT